jgi:hypothetical protein
MSPLFDEMYSEIGRPSIAPENRGIFKVGWIFTFAAAAYNLVRMRKLLGPAVLSA